MGYAVRRSIGLARVVAGFRWLQEAVVVGEFSPLEGLHLVFRQRHEEVEPAEVLWGERL